MRDVLKAMVQAILLFRSKTQNITSTMQNRLEGFQIRAAYHMVSKNKPQQMPGGEWRYPASDKVLEEARMHTITHYVEVRRQTISKYIVNWPIFIFCRDEERRHGTSPHQYWWKQSVDLDAVRARGVTPVVVATDDLISRSLGVMG